jgi:membrane protease YdiL (CAAX protease family)
MLLVDSSLHLGPLALKAWLLWLPLLLLSVLGQTAGEEVLFRGYLLQSLAARFQSPLVWAAVPAVIFTLVHWDADATMRMNLAALSSVALFAVGCTLLVWRTGNLGAAMGMHFATNVGAIIMVARSQEFRTTALIVGRPMQSPDWTIGQALCVALINGATVVLTLGLLVDPRSPLRLRSASAPSAT